MVAANSGKLFEGETFQVEIIERIDDWRTRYEQWGRGRNRAAAAAQEDDVGSDYPFVENKHAPFVPARRALPMLNLALVSSAGAYIDGTDAFDLTAAGGDPGFREIPVEVEAEDLRFAARGYDAKAVEEDMNALIPVARLLEFQGNGIIGQLNPVWWSFSGFIPDAARMTEEMLPQLASRLQRYEVQAALLIPASRLCHQSVSLAARAIEMVGIPTMMLAVDKEIVETVRAPRAAFYRGEFGRVAGQPNWPEYQRRILDEALRLIEPLDQPGAYKLTVELETEVEQQRGER